jgi:hypothetical protein
VSAVPGTLAALQSTFQAVLPFKVVVGQDFDVETSYLAVGWVSALEPGVQSTSDPADAALGRDAENFDVHCLLAVHRGNVPQAQVLTTAYGYLADLKATLQPPNHNLGGVVTRARLVEHTALIAMHEGGRMVALRFVIAVKAWS